MYHNHATTYTHKHVCILMKSQDFYNTRPMAQTLGPIYVILIMYVYFKWRHLKTCTTLGPWPKPWAILCYPYIVCILLMKISQDFYYPGPMAQTLGPFYAILILFCILLTKSQDFYNTRTMDQLPNHFVL